MVKTFLTSIFRTTIFHLRKTGEQAVNESASSLSSGYLPSSVYVEINILYSYDANGLSLQLERIVFSEQLSAFTSSVRSR